MGNIIRTPRTLTINGVKFSIENSFDIMEEKKISRVLYQTGMLERRSLEVSEFINMVKSYVVSKSRSGIFLEPVDNNKVDYEIYPA